MVITGAEGGACEAGLLPVQGFLFGDTCDLGCEICGSESFPCCSDGPACEGGMICIDSVEDFGRSMCVASCGGEGEVPCNGAALFFFLFLTNPCVDCASNQETMSCLTRSRQTSAAPQAPSSKPPKCT